MSAQQIPFLVRWSFILFVFSIPFEATGAVKIASVIFFPLYFFYYNPLPQARSLPSVQRPIWCFLAYVAIVAIESLFVETSWRTLTLIQLLAFVWIGSSLLTQKQTMRNGLLAYSIAASLVALGLILRLPHFYMESISAEGMRVTAFGGNANDLAAILVLAAVVLLGLQFHRNFRRFSQRAILAALLLPVLAAIIQTGSRGNVVAMIIGFLIYLLPSQLVKRSIARLTLGILGVLGVIYIALNNPVFMTRVQETYYEGKMAGRENISRAATEMILERPIFGWGLNFQEDLAKRLGLVFEIKDAHNLFFHIFLEVGAIGAVPFLVGVWLCGEAAWKARASDLGLMPLALLAQTLVTNLATTDINRKPMWLAFAFILGTSAMVMRTQNRRTVIRLRRATSTVRKKETMLSAHN